MRLKKLVSLLIVFAMTKALMPCAVAQGAPSGQIYLYGEQHAVASILDRELDLWSARYREEGMRHLFVELPWYTAEFLNQWMRSEDDGILDALYADWAGTALHSPDVKAFYQRLKRECPRTVLHGTDVGHQYASTGKRFLDRLEENGLEGSEAYQCAVRAVEQGERYYERSDGAYREAMMAENFIREFDSLNGESVMGIYGSAHTGVDALDAEGAVPCMAARLREVYGSNLHSEDLTWLAKEMEPLGASTVEAAGKRYQADWFGEQDLSGFKDFSSRSFWRLEGAYDDCKDLAKTGEVLPYDNYPMRIETGQVFMIEYRKTDGSAQRVFYRSDGTVWEGKPVTEAFIMR